MADTQPPRVTGIGGWTGTLWPVASSGEAGDSRAAPPSTSAPQHRNAAADQVEIQLDDTGELARVPRGAMIPQPDGGFHVPLSRDDLRRISGGQAVVVPVAEESLRVGKREQETGRVVVYIVPHEHAETVDVPVAEEQVRVERVPVDRVIDAPVPVRQEGDVTIVPVFEEVIVVSRKLKLKEELHITRTRSMRRVRQQVTVRTEEARVLRAGIPANTAETDGHMPSGAH